MTIAEIMTHANFLAATNIKETAARYYMQEAIKKLAMQFASARHYTSIEIVADAYTKYQLPEFLHVKNIQSTTEESVRGYHLDQHEGKIAFSEPGTYQVTYSHFPTQSVLTTVLSDPPPIKEVYHICLSYFIAMRHKQNLFGDQDTDVVRLNNEYVNEAIAADHVITKKRNPRRVIGDMSRYTV